MNRLTVTGRLVRENVLKDVGEDRMVLNNAIAIPRNYKTDGGPEADFINIVAWGKRAELIEKYCDKGDLVGLDGYIQSRTYQNSEDQTVYTVEMIIDSVHFLQAKKEA
ncbi:MAG: single-stranded DNA-binding protein [Atopostipes suicloacalis]|nr:single-stranded DNA-binding protein [Atopostipes suicloacalis]MDN6730632.1 single-stranded DNA-binding protein [Atopostipes suicloacalis]